MEWVVNGGAALPNECTIKTRLGSAARVRVVSNRTATLPRENGLGNKRGARLSQANAGIGNPKQILQSLVETRVFTPSPV